MKKILLIAALFIALTSCSKKEDETPTAPSTPPTSTELFIQYTYNGVIYRQTPETLNSLRKTIFAYMGINGTLNKINLYMPITPAVGTFNITDSPSNINAYGSFF